MIVFSTSMGDFKIEMHASKAPLSVKNFYDYLAAGFFDDTIFHRVIPGFMIQGGGFDIHMNQKQTKAPILNEAENGLKNERGTLSMARTQDANSATSQFFLNVSDNAFLDHGDRDFGYAVFAAVIEGMDVVDAIAGVKTGSVGMHTDLPVEPVIIKSAVRVEVD